MNIYEISVTLLCLSGFFYQTSYLLNEFTSGKSVVNLQLDQELDDGLPAVTICPGALSLDKIARVSAQLDQTFQLYLALGNGSDHMQRQRTFYSKAQKLFNQLISDGQINVASLFYNYTFNNVDQGNRHRINIRVHSLKHRFNAKIEPIVSLWRDYGHTKCFTYFSHLDPLWANVTIDFRQITMEVKFDRMSMAHKLQPVPFILHSPNDFPLMEIGKLKVLFPNSLYHVQFSIAKVEGLSGRNDYRDYGAQHQFKTRSDCLTQCLQNAHDQVCGGTQVVRLPTLIREDFILLNWNRTYSNCQNYSEIKQRSEAACLNKCKQNREFKYYLVNLQRAFDYDDGKTKIMINHNEMPDIVIRHMPEISFISMVCNFGGLLGMWLGLSFLAISQYIERFVMKFVKVNSNKYKGPMKVVIQMINFNSNRCSSR